MEWQPIETAPTDGTHVLLERRGVQFVGYYGGVNSGWHLNMHPCNSIWPIPEKWMPLPKKRSNEMDWLEVEKELPKDNKDKIVYSASRGVGFAWINSLKNQWFFHDIGAVGRGYYLKDITHWMPLPKPPTD